VNFRQWLLRKNEDHGLSGGMHSIDQEADSGLHRLQQGKLFYPDSMPKTRMGRRIDKKFKHKKSKKK